LLVSRRIYGSHVSREHGIWCHASAPGPRPSAQYVRQWRGTDERSHIYLSVPHHRWIYCKFVGTDKYIVLRSLAIYSLVCLSVNRWIYTIFIGLIIIFVSLNRWIFLCFGRYDSERDERKLRPRVSCGELVFWLFLYRRIGPPSWAKICYLTAFLRAGP
jgi:hypothetical protein